MRSHGLKALVLLGVAAGLLFPAAARAGAVLSAPAVISHAGDVGDTFDVLLVYTGPTISVKGIAFEITTTNTNITFTDARTNTATPYIFAGTSDFGPDIVTTTGQTLDASDITSASSGVSIVAGSYGLGHVTFNVAAQAGSGPFVLTLNVNGSSLSDQNGGNIPVTLSNGQITISSSTVPEPSLLVLVFSALCGLVAIRHRLAYRAYGSMVVYLRMKNLVPPASEPRGPQQKK